MKASTDNAYREGVVQMEFWVLNTDEAEAEGRDADRKMLSRSRVAAWGETFGAEGKLGKPEPGDRVFFYKNGVGVVAMATFDHTDPFSSNDIFGMQHKGEFHRQVIDLRTSPVRALSCTAIESGTGKRFRPLSTIFRIKIPEIASFLEASFPTPQRGGQ